jgi:DNA-binding NarL/FixJ family response regulator
MLEEQPQVGLSVVAELRTKRPETKCIVLLDSAKAETVVDAFRAGAQGVFCRDEPIKTLCKCIAVVHAGQIWANSAQLRFILNALVRSASTQHALTLEVLSDREQDVVRALAEGLSNREIADLLNISRHTVKNYLFRIFEKVGVSSRVELLRYVFAANGSNNPARTVRWESRSFLRRNLQRSSDRPS